jgi:hypothetical protein
MALVCFLCNTNISGYVDGLKNHLRVVHGLFYKKDSMVHFQCKQENCARPNTIFKYFYQLRNHIKSNHPDSSGAVNVEAATNQHSDNAGHSSDNFQSSASLRNAIEPDVPISFNIPRGDVENNTKLDDFENETILNFKADLTCTQTVLDSVVATMNTHTSITQALLKKHVETFFNKKKMQDDPDAIELLAKFSRNSQLSKLSTNHLQMKAIKKNFIYVEPREICLGTRTDTNARGCKRRNVESFQSVSIIDTLQALLSINEYRNAMENEENCSCDSEYRSFRDGILYKSSPYFKKFPRSLRITIYYDDVEITNPLGSRTGIHKLGCFYFTIQNMPRYLKSKLDNIFVLAFCYSEDMKKYGVNQILTPFVEDMKCLESDAGVKGNFDENYIIRAVLTNVSADSAAAHDMLGFMGCGAKYFCRQCIISRPEIQETPMKISELRSKPEHDKILAGLSDEKYGVAFDSILNELTFFHSTTNFAFDLMHDFLEGVCKFTLKYVLHHYIFIKKAFNIALLNHRIHNFHYGLADAKNRPSENFNQKPVKDLNDSCVKQKAVQVWLLMRSLPFLIYKEVQTEMEDQNTHIQLIVLLNKVFAIYTSSCLTDGLLYYAHCLYAEFLQLFRKLYNRLRIINKLHHITHYLEAIQHIGPLIEYWCTRYEGFHKRAKAVTKICNNFKNMPKTVAKKIQIMNCRHLHRSKKNGINYHDVQRKKRKLISIHGTQYTPGVYVCLTTTNMMPQFGKILKVPVDKDGTFKIQKFTSIYHDLFLNAYQITPCEEIEDLCFESFVDHRIYSPWKPIGSNESFICLKSWSE